MNRISLKLLSVLAIILFIAVIPIAVFAANESISVVHKIDGEQKGYIIFIEGYTDKTFKYAFTNLENADPSPNSMDLQFIISSSNLSGSENQAAFLDAATYEKLSENDKPIYMWAKDETEKLILEGIQLDLNEALTEEKISNLEKLTENIKVKIAEKEEDTTTIKNENVDGIEEVTRVGYVQILDDETATYYYDLVKIPSEKDEYNQLKTFAKRIQTEYEGLDIYNKIQFVSEFDELFATIDISSDWKEVKDMMVKQPEESVQGDEYIVLLKKVDKDGKETIDVQFLTALESYKPNLVTEQVVTQETTKLPITYDSIALFVILGIVVILVVAVFIRMKKLSKQDEEK